MEIVKKSDLSTLIAHAKSWNDIHEAIKESPQSGKLFEEFCKYYYLAEPGIRRDYINVWLYSETPPLVKDRLNISLRDYGIDLILEDNSNRFTAVQCKFRSNQNEFLSWSKDKIANLFAEGDKADNLLIFTNASGLDEHSKKKGADRFKLVTLGDLLLIQPETIRIIVNLCEGKKPLLHTRAVPRPYQHVAIQKVLNGFMVSNRGQLILPCGAGKTLTALWIKEALLAKKTLVLVPSLALLRQTKHEWNCHQLSWTKYICVCSEEDITRGDNKDFPVVHTYEIEGLVTTNSKQIRENLLNNEKIVVYSTYQSLNKICKAMKGTNFKFDLAICDEAHKTAGSKLSAFGLIHDDINIQVVKRLYMTATPRIVSEQIKKKLEDYNYKYLADMSNPDIYGNEFYRMSFKQAIDRNILVDYQIVAIGIDDKELHERIHGRTHVKPKLYLEDIAHNYALEKVMNEFNAKHAITFHSSIKRAKEFKERHEELYTNFHTEHVSGIQSTNTRNVLMDKFRNASKAVITNARCLTEGIDVPAIDMVYFCDPKNSKIDIVQATGRTLRKAVHKNKVKGYVVVPIFHNEKEKVEHTIDGSAFSNLVKVVRALGDQDERLQVEINKLCLEYRLGNDSSNHIQIRNENVIIIFDGFDKKLKTQLFAQILDKTADSWMKYFNALKEYRLKYPNVFPLAREVHLGYKIGSWCNTQRVYANSKQLSRERYNLLKSIGFWWDPEDEKWNKNYGALVEYRIKHPNKWPLAEDTMNGYRIGSWCRRQRQRYRKKKLKKEQKHLLDKIGFPWNPIDTWDINYGLILEYRSKYPDKWPTSTEEYKNVKLGPWCANIRRDIKKKRLSPQRVELLNKIGFWRGFEDSWDKHFDLLVEYRRQKPDKWPGFKEVYKEFKIGVWCDVQRQAKKRGKLSVVKADKLNRIGFIWVPKDTWNTKYQILKHYRESHPDHWPTKYDGIIKGIKLGQWCDWNRDKYRKGKLSKDKIKYLKVIGFQFNAPDLWQETFNLLVLYQKTHPGEWIKQKTKYMGCNLGVWCTTQRTDYRKGRMTHMRINMLNKINFRWGK